MGFETFGFGGGRADTWEPEELYWGPEGTWLGDERYSGERQLQNPLGAVQMGLIYVNPEGPNGNPDPLASARDIRETFARMAMNDEETVALIAGGHSFGKTHGAGDPSFVGPEPRRCHDRESGPRLEEQARQGSRRGRHHRRSRSHLVADADEVEQPLLRQPLQIRMGARQEPRRRQAVEGEERAVRHPRRARCREDASAHDADHRPRAALRSGLREDLAAFLRASEQFADAFARAWFKLTHRDMGPVVRYLGKLVPKQELIWQDPVPAGTTLGDGDVAALKAKILDSGLSVPELVSAAWASASTFRGSDKRGGANGARVRLAPQKDWEANDPAQLHKVLAKLETIQKDSGTKSRSRTSSSSAVPPRWRRRRKTPASA